MRLCIITDEISQDLVRALTVCENERISTFELRAVHEANVVSHNDTCLGEIVSSDCLGNIYGLG